MLDKAIGFRWDSGLWVWHSRSEFWAEDDDWKPLTGDRLDGQIDRQVGRESSHSGCDLPWAGHKVEEKVGQDQAPRNMNL